MAAAGCSLLALVALAGLWPLLGLTTSSGSSTWTSSAACACCTPADPCYCPEWSGTPPSTVHVVFPSGTSLPCITAGTSYALAWGVHAGMWAYESNACTGYPGDGTNPGLRISVLAGASNGTGCLFAVKVLYTKSDGSNYEYAANTGFVSLSSVCGPFHFTVGAMSGSGGMFPTPGSNPPSGTAVTL